MKEYQHVNNRDYILPKAVYYQCIWLVRDMPRLYGITQGEEDNYDVNSDVTEDMLRILAAGASEISDGIETDYSAWEEGFKPDSDADKIIADLLSEDKIMRRPANNSGNELRTRNNARDNSSIDSYIDSNTDTDYNESDTSNIEFITVKKEDRSLQRLSVSTVICKEYEIIGKELYLAETYIYDKPTEPVSRKLSSYDYLDRGNSGKGNWAKGNMHLRETNEAPYSAAPMSFNSRRNKLPESSNPKAYIFEPAASRRSRIDTSVKNSKSEENNIWPENPSQRSSAIETPLSGSYTADKPQSNRTSNIPLSDFSNSLLVTEASYKLDCLYTALTVVPEEFREGILDSIINRGKGYSDFAHENTWKCWKQRFMYEFAKKLRFI